MVQYHVAVPLFAQPADRAPDSALAAKMNRMANIAPDGLGESPVWDHRTQTLYWIDIVAQTLTAAHLGSAIPRGANPNPGASTSAGPAWLASILPKVTRYVLPGDTIGFVVPTERPHLVVLGSNRGLLLFDLRAGKVASRGAHPERHLGRNRFNDAKVGPGGRLYGGTMQMKLMASDKREPGSGRFYRMDSFKGQPKAVEAVGPTTVSNGIGWTPDEQHFFHIDTPTKTVFKYDFDGRTGAITNKRVLRDMGQLLDGMCVDADGHLWVALLQKAEVHRLDKDSGETLAIVQVPGAKLVTSCCFGGPNLSLLFITTSAGTTPDAVAETRRADPHGVSGHVFVADVGVTGNLTVPFKLDLERSKL